MCRRLDSNQHTLPSEGCARSTWRRRSMRCVRGTRGRIRTCGRTINRRLRFQLRHPGKDVPTRATPWGITGSMHAVRVPPGSRTLLAGLEDRVLAARTAVHESSAPDLHRHVTRLQLAAYLFRSSGANERRKRRRRESNARDCRRPRFSGPACYHSSTSPNVCFSVPTRGLEPPEPAFVALAAIQLPWACCVACGIRTRVSALRGQRPRPTRRTRQTRAEESNLWGSSPPPRFSGPVDDHSSALSMQMRSG